MLADDFSSSQVTVKKTVLLEKLRANRAVHRETFLEAQKGYRAEVIKRLDSMLEDARNNKRIRTNVELVAPMDCTADYDRVIAMLEMSVKDEITISETHFRQFVLDEWTWKGQFTASNARYLNKGES